jgi:hypothetical protein
VRSCLRGADPVRARLIDERPDFDPRAWMIQLPLSKLPDDELIRELTTIPGIGPWTVPGALLIALGREDIVLPGDWPWVRPS